MNYIEKVMSAAVGWWLKDVSVIPLKYRDKTPAVPSWKKYQDELPELADVAIWFWKRRRNLGVIMRNGLTVLDFDGPNVWQEWLTWADRYTEIAKITGYRVQTARGFHVYVWLNSPFDTILKIHRGDEHMEIRGNGSYVVAPPSVHPSGARYELVGSEDIGRASSIETLVPKDWLDQAADRDQTPPAPPTNIKPGDLDKWILTDAADVASYPIKLEKGDAAKIKSQIPITDIIPGPIKPAKNGDSIAHCPLHNDEKMSFHVYGGTKGWCFGGCSQRGSHPFDVISLFGFMNGIPPREAISALKRRLIYGKNWQER